MSRGDDRRSGAAGEGHYGAGGGHPKNMSGRGQAEGGWHRREVVVRQNVGTHLRVVKRIFERALRMDVEMFVTSSQHRASARSMLDLMQLAARPGDRVWIESRGPDAERAAAYAAAVLQAAEWDAEIPDA